jgi:4-diphosphocytidyl-2-C-methyl-D-erythritol kinase
MINSLSLKAPAKINFYLQITGNRADGYHDLVMIMQSVDLSDRIDLRKIPGGGIVVHCEHPQVPQDQTNLAYRAARLMQQKFPVVGGVAINIHKHIPIAAGLAGGSTDAAAVLVGIDRLWQLGLTQPELRDLAAQLGSDIPFCISGGTALATGRGEIITPIADLADVAIVICKPKDIAISTAWAYQTFRAEGLLTKGNRLDHDRSREMLEVIEKAKDKQGQEFAALTAQLGQLLYNDLERVVLPAHPAIVKLKQLLQAQAPLGVLMSGSGATVFAIAQDITQAEQIATTAVAQLPNVEAWVTKTIASGIQDFLG